MVRYYGKVAYIKNILKMARGWMHTPHLIPVDPPLANGHKLQKPLKESGIYQSFGTISFVGFLLKGRVKRGRDGTMPLSLNTLLPRRLRLGACERLTSSFTKG